MADKADKDSKHLLAGAAKVASYNMILQLMLRMMTFCMNAIVLRYISKDMLGVVNVRLVLLYSTTMFLATEAFNKACLSKLEKENWQQIINLSWLSVPVTVVVSWLLGAMWLYLLEVPDATTLPYYGVSVVSFTVSALLCNITQPLYVVGQKCLFVKLNVLAVGIGELCRCSITVILVIWAPHYGLINFAIAQICYGAVVLLVYYGYFFYYITLHSKKDDGFHFRSMAQLLPAKPDRKSFFDEHQLWLTVSIFKQSFLKQLLTEGEKYVMTIFGVLSFADQGVYDVVNNLGSMAARFIFKPIEDGGYLFFSQLLVRGEPEHRQKQDSVKLATDVLSCLLKLVILIGATILVFGNAYSYLALDLYGGQILTSGSGPVLLRWYCLYVLVIAINGTTECFVFATMSKLEVDRYNHKMLGFSAVFLISSLALTRQFGSVGFILANCLNMLARIIHSIVYIRDYFKDSVYRPLQHVTPSSPVLVSLVASFCITVISERYFCCSAGLVWQLVHIGVGGVCGVSVLAVMYLREKDVIHFIQEQYRARHKVS